ncbi:MAG: type II toxin-antitoxin system Phd/YefM family antitoxin [Acidimicrobiales bacterium]|nr:MAG: type II toxin-antitoxin system Phd/YefM family antitoxin [Acidimicrobiales bacterium]
MAITASQLRQNVYRLLDEVISSGIPLEIERNNRRLRIVSLEAPSKLARLKSHTGAIAGDPENLVSSDWSAEWRP